MIVLLDRLVMSVHTPEESRKSADERNGCDICLYGPTHLTQNKCFQLHLFTCEFQNFTFLNS